MLTRRRFAGIAAAGWIAGEAAFAQRALPPGETPPDTVWLNANENPEGPPKQSLDALMRVAPETGRYHFGEFFEVHRAIAASEGLEPSQVLAGTGSTEVLNAAVAAFTSPELPLICPEPTFEAPAETARALGRPVVMTALTPSWSADVKRLEAAARDAGGGLLYVCNPNNPTSSMAPGSELEWLARNLPRNTVLVVDEAYIHFASAYPGETALRWVREGREVVVARTFSKIYGMAGLRIGFVCAKPDLIRRMRPFRNNAFSIAGARAAVAALQAGPVLVADRKTRLVRVRAGLCAWLRERGVRYIEPHANFVMIEIGRDAREFGMEMFRRGVAVGRPFPPLDRMLRVTIGTEPEMAKFRTAFAAAFV